MRVPCSLPTLGNRAGSACDRRHSLKVICPVVFELNRNAEGGVIIGLGTQIACDLAVSTAKENPGNSIVITPGGCAGKAWDYVWTGGLMGKYIKAQTKARVLKQMADTFDTFGETSRLTYTVLHLCHREQCISEIVLAVRSRQASRAELICRQLLNKLNLHHIPVLTGTYELPSAVENSRKNMSTPAPAGSLPVNRW